MQSLAVCFSIEPGAGTHHVVVCRKIKRDELYAAPALAGSNLTARLGVVGCQ
jgi:hypothetical protein